MEQRLFRKFLITKANGDPLDPEAKYFVFRYDARSKDGRARYYLKQFAIEMSFDELLADVEHEEALAEELAAIAKFEE